MTKNDYLRLAKLCDALTLKRPLLVAAALNRCLPSEDEDGNDIMAPVPDAVAACAFEACERMIDEWLAERQHRPTRETLKTLQKSERMKERGAEQVARMNEAKALSGNMGGRPKKVKP